MSRRLAAVLLLCAFFSLANAQPTAAQGEEPSGRPVWMLALSFSFSVVAISSAAVGVVELSVSPKLFWAMQVMALVFLGAGFVTVDLESPFFFMPVLAALAMVIVLISLLLVRTISKALTRP